MTPNKENFIKAVYELGGDQHIVSNKDLVESLGVSAASVTDMNARLVKEEFIVYKPYKGVKLSDNGIQAAQQLIRKHRLWEVFLSENLGYNWSEVHSDADLLEHASSDLLIERLDQFLGYPTIDPHGDTIPRKHGLVEEKEYVPLIEANAGDLVKIKKVDDYDEFLNYLSDKGLHLDKEFTIKKVEDFEGPILLEDEDHIETIISYKAAFKILIEII